MSLCGFVGMGVCCEGIKDYRGQDLEENFSNIILGNSQFVLNYTCAYETRLLGSAAAATNLSLVRCGTKSSKLGSEKCSPRLGPICTLLRTDGHRTTEGCCAVTYSHAQSESSRDLDTNGPFCGT